VVGILCNEEEEKERKKRKKKKKKKKKIRFPTKKKGKKE
jgi:hypothetical protein